MRPAVAKTPHARSSVELGPGAGHGIIWIIAVMGFLTTVSAQTAAFQEVSQQAGLGTPGAYLGVAAGDYDGDGDDDLYFSNQAGSNVLYENRGDGTFLDVTTAAGVKTARNGFSAVWGDIDNDGDLDLFAGVWGSENHLFINNEDKTFHDATAAAGLLLRANTGHALMADVDRDGFVDLYLTVTDGAGNRLYHNNGNGTFTDVSQGSGADYRGRGMGAGFFDYDRDGDLDLFLVHDYEQANQLLQNDGAGHFVDVAARAGVNHAGEGMGVDFGDYDNDGWLDLFVTDMYGNLLYRNNGDGTFSNVSTSAGINAKGMSWGCNFVDADNDGRLDIFVALESHFWRFQENFPNLFYWNKGDGSFANVAGSAGVAMQYDSFGSAALDYDHDGWLDLAVANDAILTANEFFKNLGGAHHWLQVHLEGTRSNRAAVGARVEAFAAAWRRVDEVRAGSGYNSQSSLTLEFGLGSRSHVDSLVVYWPAGTVERYLEIAADRRIKIIEGSGLVTQVTTAQAHPMLADFAVLQNYPNPFNPTTIIRYGLPDQSAVTFRVIDVQGREVNFMALGTQSAGWHEVNFRAAQLHSGVYWYQLDMTPIANPGRRATRSGKMVLLQ